MFSERRNCYRVVFKIKSSKRSNNGTDVGSGQIPEILYRIPEVEKDAGLQIQLLDKSFSTTVSAVSGFESRHPSAHYAYQISRMV